MKKRNAYIDLQKFFYCVVIAVFHFYVETRIHVPGGGHAVEFFVLASGVYFFSGGVERSKRITDQAQRVWYPFKFFLKRFLQFFPYTTWAFGLAFIVSRIVKPIAAGKGISIGKLADGFAKDAAEVLLIGMNGMTRERQFLNAPVWTLSAILIVEFLILLIVVRKETLYTTVLAPLFILVGYGVWANSESTAFAVWCGLLTFGMLRVLIATSLSYYVLCLARRLAAAEIRMQGRIALTLAELSLHGTALVIIAHRSNRYYRWICTCLFAFALAITISKKSLTAEWIKQTALTDFLGKWSMAIYLIHFPIYNLYRILYPTTELCYPHFWSYLAWVGFGGILLLLVSKWSVRACRRIGHFVKKCMFAAENPLSPLDISKTTNL